MFGRGGREVCKFFLQGRCRFGDNCKNEHPSGQDNAQSQGGGFGNRFAPLNNNNNNSNNQGGARNRNGAFGSSSTPNQDKNPYLVTAETIEIDLTTERPIWPLSSYGPGKNAPLQLIEGEIEQSPEEMRVRHYLAVAQGNPQESVQLEAQTAAKANEAIQRILGDINGAVKYIIDGKDQHPNRLDMEVKGPDVQPSQQTNAFGAPTGAAPATSGFGQPSGVGQQSSAFGKPAFGQPAAQTSTFGQASAFGKPSQPGFGQASAVGGGGSAFGQPSNPAQNSAFGQPSAVGGGASAFGQPSAPGMGGGASAFGQPSAPGSGGGASAFGQPSAPGQSTGFGQPSQMGAKPAFGQSTFGQSSQPAFGQASKPAFGQASAASPSPFAAAASKPSGFAQAAQQPATGFGQPSPFGTAASKPSPFAAAGQAQQQQQQQQSPFAAAPNSNATPASNPFGGSSQSAFGQPSQPAAQNPFGTGAAASNAPKPAFGQPTQSAASAFGQPSQPAPTGNPFGQTQPSQQQQQQQQPNGASHTSSSASASATPTAGPDPSTYLTLDASQNPISFKQQAVTTISKDDGKTSFPVYQNAANNGQPEHLWFPNGPPAAKPDSQLPDDDVFYSGALGKELQAIYEAVASRGAFVGGVMPEVPPKREWVRFDL